MLPWSALKSFIRALCALPLAPRLATPAEDPPALAPNSPNLAPFLSWHQAALSDAQSTESYFSYQLLPDPTTSERRACPLQAPPNARLLSCLRYRTRTASLVACCAQKLNSTSIDALALLSPTRRSVTILLRPLPGLGMKPTHPSRWTHPPKSHCPGPSCLCANREIPLLSRTGGKRLLSLARDCKPK